MPKAKITFAILTLILETLVCNTFVPAAEPTSTMVVIVEPTLPVQTPELPASEAEVPRVPLEEAMVAYTAGAAIFVDVRGPSAYDMSHVAGAINIPLGAIEKDPNNLNLDKEQWIITYCT
jgi:hypothetical protein